MRWLLASWAGALIVVCRWIWAATRNGSGLEEAETLEKVRTAAGLEPTPV